MSLASGASMWRHSRGRYTEDEIPAANTKVARGKLTARAARGDEPAKEALRRHRAAVLASAYTGHDPLDVQTGDEGGTDV